MPVVVILVSNASRATMLFRAVVHECDRLLRAHNEIKETAASTTAQDKGTSKQVSLTLPQLAQVYSLLAEALYQLGLSAFPSENADATTTGVSSSTSSSKAADATGSLDSYSYYLDAGYERCLTGADLVTPEHSSALHVKAIKIAVKQVRCPAALGWIGG
jgi:hypothetical protein